MTDELRLPESVRARVKEARIAAVQAQAVIEKYDGMMLTALEMLGIDPASNPRIDFDTGVITPAPAPMKPELVKKDEAVS